MSNCVNTNDSSRLGHTKPISNYDAGIPTPVLSHACPRGTETERVQSPMGSWVNHLHNPGYQAPCYPAIHPGQSNPVITPVESLNVYQTASWFWTVATLQNWSEAQQYFQAAYNAGIDGYTLLGLQMPHLSNLGIKPEHVGHYAMLINALRNETQFTAEKMGRLTLSPQGRSPTSPWAGMAMPRMQLSRSAPCYQQTMSPMSPMRCHSWSPVQPQMPQPWSPQRPQGMPTLSAGQGAPPTPQNSSWVILDPSHSAGNLNASSTSEELLIKRRVSTECVSENENTVPGLVQPQLSPVNSMGSTTSSQRPLQPPSLTPRNSWSSQEGHPHVPPSPALSARSHHSSTSHSSSISGTPAMMIHPTLLDNVTPTGGRSSFRALNGNLLMANRTPIMTPMMHTPDLSSRESTPCSVVSGPMTMAPGFWAPGGYSSGTDSVYTCHSQASSMCPRAPSSGSNVATGKNDKSANKPAKSKTESADGKPAKKSFFRPRPDNVIPFVTTTRLTVRPGKSTEKNSGQVRKRFDILKGSTVWCNREKNNRMRVVRIEGSLIVGSEKLTGVKWPLLEPRGYGWVSARSQMREYLTPLAQKE